MSQAITLRELCAATGWSSRHSRRQVRSWGVRAHGAITPDKVPVDIAAKIMKRRGGDAPRLVVATPLLPAVSSQLPQVGSVASSPIRADSAGLASDRYEMIAPLAHPDSDAHAKIWRQHGTESQVVKFLAAHHNKSERTIWRMLERYREGGLPALADKVRKDKGQGRADQLGHGMNEAAMAFVAGALQPEGSEKLKVRDIWRNYCDERKLRMRFPERGAQLPECSYNTMALWWSRVPRPLKTLAFDGERAFSVHEEILSVRKRPRDPNDWWVGDHRERDVFCMEPDPDSENGGWRLFRPYATVWIDWCTWRATGWLTVKTPSSDSIAASLRRGVLNHGVPRNVYTDNGRDYASHYICGGRSFRTPKLTTAPLDAKRVGVYQSMGIDVTFAKPHNSRAKPIEPWFGRLSAADRQLPVWCGHNPEARNERFEELLALHKRWAAGEVFAKPQFKGRPWPFMAIFPTIEELAELDEMVFPAINAQPFGPGTPGARKLLPDGTSGWMSPQEMWDLRSAQAEIRPADPLLVQASFLHKLTGRDGIVVENTAVSKEWHRRRYVYRNDAELLRMTALNGCRVDIGYDPLDYDTVAVYFDGQFVCLASDIQRREMGRADYLPDERNRRAQKRACKDVLLQLIPNDGYIERVRRGDREGVQARDSLALQPSLTERFSENAALPDVAGFVALPAGEVQDERVFEHDSPVAGEAPGVRSGYDFLDEL